MVEQTYFLQFKCKKKQKKNISLEQFLSIKYGQMMNLVGSGRIKHSDISLNCSSWLLEHSSWFVTSPKKTLSMSAPSSSPTNQYYTSANDYKYIYKTIKLS